MQTQLSEQAFRFQNELKDEIIRQINTLNLMNDGDLQDGFSTTYVDDGWVSYKGMAWGFVLHFDPICFDMTFGPDWPFVGHRTVIMATDGQRGMNWCMQDNPQIVFETAAQMANYGLRRLAEKAHDGYLFQTEQQQPFMDNNANFAAENI